MQLISSIVVILCFILLCMFIIILSIENKKKSIFIDNRFYKFHIKQLYDKSQMLYLACNRFYGQMLMEPVIFLVDTGANTNFISEDFLSEYYPNYKEHIEYADDVLSVNGKMTLNRMLNVPVGFDNGMQIKEDFTLLCETSSLDYLTEECGYQVVGILGSSFLKKHNAVIDFVTMSLTIPK